jgi:glutamate racemase
MPNKNQSHKNPIGIFDSGVGGLTVANAVVHLLPQEEIIYFGDTAHLPYGDKSPDTIRRYCYRITQFLIDKGCKIIVIACNSASATAYDYLVEHFGEQVTIINVIDPLVEKVAEQHFDEVGVIATKATIATAIYKTKLGKASPNTLVQSLAAPLIVPMIEENFFQNRISHDIIKYYINRDVFQNIEAMLLCCTHYPLIKKEIEALFHKKIVVFDNGDVVAQKVKSYLTEHHLLNDKKELEHQFYVSDYTQSFEQTTRLFYGELVSLEERVL